MIRRNNFDYEVLHLDYYNTRLEAIKRVYGPDVELRSLHQRRSACS